MTPFISFPTFASYFRYPPPSSQIIPYNSGPTPSLEVRQRSTRPGSTSFQGFVPIGLGALPPASQHGGGASAK